MRESRAAESSSAGEPERQYAPVTAGAADVAWLVLAAMPLVLAFANRSSALIIAVAAVAAVVIRLAAESPPVLARRLGEPLLRPAAWPFVGFAALALASIAWSATPARSAFALGEAIVPAAAAGLLVGALRRPPSRRVIAVFGACCLLACAEILFEIATGFTWRRDLGLRSLAFITNKPVIALTLFLWPVLVLIGVLAQRKGLPAPSDGTRTAMQAVVAGLIAATVMVSHSGAAMAAIAGAAIVYGAACVWPRLTRRVVMVALLAALALAPFKGELAASLIPDAALDRLQSAHARDRVNIWLSFGEVVARRPITGIGFGASATAIRDPVAAEVPAPRRPLLDVGHPHDMLLQIWVELGVLGAALTAAVLAVLWRALAKLQPAPHAGALACVAAAAIIAQVGHGAWQGWWIAVVGATALWFWAAAAPMVMHSPEGSLS